MKTYYFILAFFLLGINCYSQGVSSVDVNNPISSIKYYYNNVGNLEISITLSEINLASSEDENFLNPDNFQFSRLEGFVDWESKNIKNQVELTLQNQSDNKFKYTASFQVRDGANTYPILKNNFKGKVADNKWTAIKNINIKYTIGGVEKRLPLFDIQPEITLVGAINNSLSVVKGEYYQKDRAQLTIKTEPLAASGKLIKLKIYNTDGASYEFSPNLLSKNGLYVVEITNAPINFTEGNWLVEAEVDIDESGLANAKTVSNSKVYLKYKPKLKVLNIDDKFFVDVKGKSSTSIQIQTKGEGQLRLRFIPDIIKSFNVAINSSVNETGLFTFNIDNLDNIPKDRTIYFDIINEEGNLLTKGQHLFINTTPKLDNFSIDVSKGQSKINFDLPSSVKLSSISIRLDDLGISASGEKNIKLIKKGEENQLSSYEANFGGVGFNKLYETIKKDSVIVSSLSVLIGGNSVYKIKLQFVSQKYINDKLKELAELSAQKVKKKDKEKKKEQIKETLTEIVSVIGKLDEVVENDDIIATVDTLAEGDDKDKAGEVMETIGKIGSWVGTLGPIVIPLLL